MRAVLSCALLTDPVLCLCNLALQQPDFARCARTLLCCLADTTTDARYALARAAYSHAPRARCCACLLALPCAASDFRAVPACPRVNPVGRPRPVRLQRCLLAFCALLTRALCAAVRLTAYRHVLVCVPCQVCARPLTRCLLFLAALLLATTARRRLVRAQRLLDFLKHARVLTRPLWSCFLRPQRTGPYPLYSLCGACCAALLTCVPLAFLPPCQQPDVARCVSMLTRRSHAARDARQRRSARYLQRTL
jgi:hypothetical protein